jgi:CHAD domain-containing protein
LTPLLKTTREYWKDFSRKWKDARHDLNEENVHDLRVASRRTVSGLSLLESILEDRPSNARHRIKRLMHKLGPLRDIQVQISIVEKWTPTRTVKTFLKSLERTRKKESRQTLKYLSSERKTKIRESLRTFEDRSKERLESMSSGTVRTRINAALMKQREVVEATRSSATPSDPQSLHRFRVAIRKLRYFIEAATPETGRATAAELRSLRRHSTELGSQRDLQLLKEKFRNWQSRHGSVRARL